LFERFPIFSFPRGEPICTPPVDNYRRRRWTRKFRIFGKDQEAVFFDQRAIDEQLFALSYDIGVALGRRTFLQDGGRTMQYDEPVRCALALCFSSLDATEKRATRLSFCGRLCDWREDVGAEYGKELPNTRQKDFHVLTIRFRKLRAASLILFERESADLTGLSEKLAFEIPYMCLSEILVFANKNNRRDPKLLCLVLLESVANDFRLTDVRSRCIGKRIAAKRI